MNKITLTQAYDIIFKDYPDVVGVKELSVMLGICSKKVYELLRIGKIPAIPYLWICDWKQLSRPLPIPHTSVTQKTFAKSSHILTITLCWTSLNPYIFKAFTTKCILTVYRGIP